MTPAERQKLYRQRNPEKAKEIKRNWLEKVKQDPVKLEQYRKVRRARVDKWRELNPEKVKEQSAAHHKRSYAIHRERILEQKQQQIRTLKFQVFQVFGNKCNRCGFDDWRALQIDHVNGGGRGEATVTTSTTYYKKVMNDNANTYQLLCANCNWIKRWENNEMVTRKVSI